MGVENPRRVVEVREERHGSRQCQALLPLIAEDLSTFDVGTHMVPRLRGLRCAVYGVATVQYYHLGGYRSSRCPRLLGSLLQVLVPNIQF